MRNSNLNFFFATRLSLKRKFLFFFRLAYTKFLSHVDSSLHDKSHACIDKGHILLEVFLLQKESYNKLDIILIVKYKKKPHVGTF